MKMSKLAILYPVSVTVHPRDIQLTHAYSHGRSLRDPASCSEAASMPPAPLIVGVEAAREGLGI